LWVKGVNGEQDWFAQSKDNTVSSSAAGPPSRPASLDAAWQREDGKKFVARINFSLTEITRAFDALQAAPDALPTRMEIMVGDIEPRVAIFLRKDQQVMPLRQISYTVSAR
jgi:hypothetical protein